MNKSCNLLRRVMLVTVAGALIAPSLGCAGLLSAILWLKDGRVIDAECSALEGKRVAVVCVSEDSAFGPDRTAESIARQVEHLLSEKVRRIEVIDQEEIVDWIDNNDFREMDYLDIGRGVDADLVVGIDVAGFRLQDSTTLYRGRARVTVRVYDMLNDGKVVFRDEMPEVSFPKNSGISSTEITESRFRGGFIRILSESIARKFFDYDFDSTFANEATLSGA